jgi:polyferredoxin
MPFRMQKPAPQPASYPRNTAPRAAPWRRAAQLGFLLWLLWLGLRFWQWEQQLAGGGVPTIPRPPGVEGFLPISALVSLKLWFSQGVFTVVHPAGLVLLLLIGLIALALKKGFCSWVCPVGLLSELLEGLHKRVFRQRLALPRGLDWPLRMVKYLLFAFFYITIMVGMTGDQAQQFVYGDYNKVADIIMLRFFTSMSPTALIVLLLLLSLSFVIPYFWCRYLCPYGALLGLLSTASPLNIKRVPASCIDCRACTRACPALLPVHRMEEVSSDECHACMKCSDACPVADTLAFGLAPRRGRIPGWAYAAVITGLFIAVPLLAWGLGHWVSDIPHSEYQRILPQIEDLQHTGV